MADVQNFAPNFQISPNAFKRDNDPYSQILPMLLQGQQQAEANRKKQMILQLLGQMGGGQSPQQPMGQPQVQMPKPPGMPMGQPPMPGMGGPQIPPQPMGGMGMPPQAGGQPPQQGGFQGIDPRMLQLLYATDSLGTALPALIKATSKTQGMTPYQTATLDERKRQFDARMKSQEDVTAFKEKMAGIVADLRKRGMNTMATRVENQTQEWVAQHFILSGVFGMGPQPAGGGGEVDVDADNAEVTP